MLDRLFSQEKAYINLSVIRVEPNFEAAVSLALRLEQRGGAVTDNRVKVYNAASDTTSPEGR